MSEPLVLVILLGTNPDPTAEAMMAAARTALGRDAVVLADTSESRTDAEALAIGERVHAWAIARVSWADSSLQRARLHVHVATSNEWANDEIQFLPQDASNEKGRTVGYTLASMVQRIARNAPPVSSDGGSAAAQSPPLVPTPAPEVPTKTPTPEPRSRSRASEVDLFANGIGAIGGAATSGGAAGGVRWWPIANVGLRIAAGARLGTISEADATTTTLFAAAGPSYRVFLGSSFELGARADLALLHHAATRAPVQGPDAIRTRWLGAVDLILEGSWSLGPHAGLIAAAGAELAFGPTRVTVGGSPVADIPPARAIVELGGRLRF